MEAVSRRCPPNRDGDVYEETVPETAQHRQVDDQVHKIIDNAHDKVRLSVKRQVQQRARAESERRHAREGVRLHAQRGSTQRGGLSSLFNA